MKLSELDPKLTGSYHVPNATNELSFDCPLCGKPYRISIYVNINGKKYDNAVWGMRVEDLANIDSISLSDSIRSANHGRKKSCGWHGSVYKGEVRKEN